jgi:predicted Rossmann fold nucleotide-binding protein DprA/Smf involved in DNA uptake
MECSRFGVPGNVPAELSFHPNELNQARGEAGDERRKRGRGAANPAQGGFAGGAGRQLDLQALNELSPIEKKIYELLSAQESRHIDELVETTGLNSSAVLATLFESEMKGIIRQPPGKRFRRVRF